MGLAWIQAGFSKDPKTQMGSIVVDRFDKPAGVGYNGPPAEMNDLEVVWDREVPEGDVICKKDVIVHAEINAMERTEEDRLIDSTVYVTGMPCGPCMLAIVRKKVRRVVYFDFAKVADEGSIFADPSYRAKSLRIAGLSERGLQVEAFNGDLSWLKDWLATLQAMGVLPPGIR